MSDINCCGKEKVYDESLNEDDGFDLWASLREGEQQKQQAMENSNYGRLYLDIKAAINKKHDSPKNRTADYSRKRNYDEALRILDERFRRRLPLIDQKDWVNPYSSFAGLNIKRFHSRSLKTPDDYTAALSMYSRGD